MGTEIVFVSALTIAVAAIFWLILKSASEKIIAQYRRLSETLQLEITVPESKLLGFVRNEPSLYGHYRGREISLSVPGKGLQNTRQVETLLKVGLSDTKLKAQLTATGPLAGMRQRDSGGQARWKSGDTQFDNAVDVRSNQGEALGTLLTKERRSWLASMLKRSKGTVYIGGGALTFAKLGLIGNDHTRQEFEDALEFLCDFAESAEQSI